MVNAKDTSKKVQEDLKSVLPVANKGSAKEIEAISLDIKGKIVGAEKKIVLPGGKVLSTKYVGKSLTKNITLRLKGKPIRHVKAFVGDLYDNLPLEIKTMVNFKDQDFE